MKIYYRFQSGSGGVQKGVDKQNTDSTRGYFCIHGNSKNIQAKVSGDSGFELLQGESAGVFLGEVSGKYDMSGSPIPEEEKVEAVGAGGGSIGPGKIAKSNRIRRKRRGHRLQGGSEVTDKKF
jgi:hypothetical protein